MKKPEVTSKRIAAIAGRLLHMLSHEEIKPHECLYWGNVYIGKARDLKALAGSCLTQTSNRPTPRTRRNAK